MTGQDKTRHTIILVRYLLCLEATVYGCFYGHKMLNKLVYWRARYSHGCVRLSPSNQAGMPCRMHTYDQICCLIEIQMAAAMAMECVYDDETMEKCYINELNTVLDAQ